MFLSNLWYHSCYLLMYESLQARPINWFVQNKNSILVLSCRYQRSESKGLVELHSLLKFPRSVFPSFLFFCLGRPLYMVKHGDNKNSLDHIIEEYGSILKDTLFIFFSKFLLHIHYFLSSLFLHQRLSNSKQRYMWKLVTTSFLIV